MSFCCKKSKALKRPDIPLFIVSFSFYVAPSLVIVAQALWVRIPVWLVKKSSTS
jgi:hypothetical protein